MYLTISPDEKSKAFFDNAVATEILLEGARGIELQKDKILAGKRREGQDIYPHTVGVMWAHNEDAENLEFTATVKVSMGKGEDETSQEWTRTFYVYGSIPTLERSMDEILSDKLLQKMTSMFWIACRLPKNPFHTLWRLLSTTSRLIQDRAWSI